MALLRLPYPAHRLGRVGKAHLLVQGYKDGLPSDLPDITTGFRHLPGCIGLPPPAQTGQSQGKLTPCDMHKNDLCVNELNKILYQHEPELELIRAQTYMHSHLGNSLPASVLTDITCNHDPCQHTLDCRNELSCKSASDVHATQSLSDGVGIGETVHSQVLSTHMPR